MNEKITMVLGAVFVVGAIIYSWAMWDLPICYRLPGCPTVRSVLGVH